MKRREHAACSPPILPSRAFRCTTLPSKLVAWQALHPEAHHIAPQRATIIGTLASLLQEDRVRLTKSEERTLAQWFLKQHWKLPKRNSEGCCGCVHVAWHLFRHGREETLMHGAQEPQSVPSKNRGPQVDSKIVWSLL